MAYTRPVTFIDETNPLGPPADPATATPVDAANLHAIQDGLVNASAFVDVKLYGATGDGTTNDTTNLAAALAARENIFVSDGTYIVDAELTPQSNSRILLSPNATIKFKSTATGGVGIFHLTGKSNVVIEGGTLDGNKANNATPTGGLFGVVVDGASSRIRIRNMEAKNFPANDATGTNGGDGFYVGFLSSSSPDDVVIEDCVSHDSVRQGFTCTGGSRIKFVRPVAYNISQRNGVDIEPSATGRLTDIVVDNAHVYACSSGINIGNNNDGRIKLIAPWIHDLVAGTTTGRGIGSGTGAGTIRIVSPTIYGCLAAGIVSGANHETTILGGKITQSVATDTNVHGIVTTGRTKIVGTTIVSVSGGGSCIQGSSNTAGLEIEGCDLEVQGGTNCVWLLSSTNANIVGGTFRGPGAGTGEGVLVQTSGTGHLIAGVTFRDMNRAIDIGASCTNNRAIGCVPVNVTTPVRDLGSANEVSSSGVVAGVQTYAASNVTTDRTYDANATSIDELADVVGTLIADLRTKGLVA